MQFSIECQKRTEGSKPRALRREGLIPATLYGHQGAESMALTIKSKEAVNLVNKASINNSLVNVNVPEISWNGRALIREVQAHPWKRNLYHVSFFSIANQKSIEVVVPVKLTGNSIGVKSGGLIEQRLTELTVRCSPNNIPEDIEIDITSLQLGEMFYVGDVSFSEGIVPLDDSERVIVVITEPAKIVVSEEEEETETSES